MNKRVYIFDIDETVCNSIHKDHTNYFTPNLIPNKQMITIINKLYDEGHKIIFMTGRGAITGIDWEETTKEQLKRWGIKYHELRFIKKPLDYLYVDDKASSPEEFIRNYENK